VIEPDDHYAAIAEALLRLEGWAVEREASAPHAICRLRGDGYRLVLVSSAAGSAGGPPGQSLLAQVRGATASPVISMSSADDADSVVQEVLEQADYDLVKPFSPRRLRAAVRAVTRGRRAPAGEVSASAEVRLGDVTMGIGRLDVTLDSRRVDLSPREFAMLRLLAASPGRVFAREEIARLAWGQRGAGETRAVDRALGRLRRKLEPDSRRPRYLLTERGAGYRFQPSSGPARLDGEDHR
jgi:two-component system response regulator RegX3